MSFAATPSSAKATIASMMQGQCLSKGHQKYDKHTIKYQHISKTIKHYMTIVTYGNPCKRVDETCSKE